jgi:hypothetical protein
LFILNRDYLDTIIRIIYGDIISLQAIGSVWQGQLKQQQTAFTVTYVAAHTNTEAIF